MFAKLVLSDEETAVHPQLGYPTGYAKLCRHAHVQMQGLITPYTEGPPQRFLPYAIQNEDLGKVKEFDTLFPILNEEERDISNARRHADYLWQQLDHLGHAGFDPAKFRVDPYGNVLYWDADPASPLAWEVDHWFPHSRGGQTVVSNLRIVQCQVNQRKNKRLEFLVPWWDFQLGISINQFLSVFASKNADFRKRAFSLLFFGGENEEIDNKLVVGCHSWPHHFREKKRECGLAAAALVRVQKDMDDPLRHLNGTRAIKPTFVPSVQCGTPARRRWSVEEEEALRRAVLKYGPGSWKEIKECEPVLVNRSTVQIKDKYRLIRGDWQLDKENREDNVDRQTASSIAIHKEEKLRQLREEEKKNKEEEIGRMEEELKTLKEQNEKERIALSELEETLAKQRKRVEKQRRWSETQSQYRLCLEKMIRDTMHQSVVYKEQARLNQAACNALLARLESQKVACDTSELDLVKRFKHREKLEALARPYLTEYMSKRLREEGHTDVASCIKQPAIEELHGALEWVHEYTKADKKYTIAPLLEKMALHTEEDFNNQQRSAGAIEHSKGVGIKDAACNGVIKAPVAEPRQVRRVESPRSSTSSGLKRKASEASCELDVLVLGYEYGGDDEKVLKAESVGDNVIHSEAEGKYDHQVGGTDKEDCFSKTGEDEQLEQLLQEVLTMQGKVNAAMTDASKEEDEAVRIQRVGKCNLDKWLQMLLLNTEAGVINEDNEEQQEGGHGQEGLTALPTLENNPHDEAEDVAGDSDQQLEDEAYTLKHVEDEEKPKGVFGGLLRKLSFRQLHLEEPKTSIEGEEELQTTDPQVEEQDTQKLLHTSRREEKLHSNLAFGRHARTPSPWRRPSQQQGSKEAEAKREDDGAGREKQMNSEEWDVLEKLGKLQLGPSSMEVAREIQPSPLPRDVARERPPPPLCRETVAAREKQQPLSREVAREKQPPLSRDVAREKQQPLSREAAREKQPPPPPPLSREVAREKLHAESFACDRDFMNRMREVREEEKMSRKEKEPKSRGGQEEEPKSRYREEEEQKSGGGQEEEPKPGGGQGQSGKLTMMRRSLSVRGRTPKRERGGHGEETDALLRTSMDGGEGGMMKRKNSFFQDWDTNNKVVGFKASIKTCTQVWKKAVKKLESRIQDTTAATPT